MAQESTSDRQSSVIARAGKRQWGYDVDEVDSFLERAHEMYDADSAQLRQQDIQNVSFDLRKNGYVIAQVDATLARLERALVDQQIIREIQQRGRVAFKARTEAMYAALAKHAAREAKARFREGDAKQPSYNRKQVDRLIDRIIAKLALEVGADTATHKDRRRLEVVTSDYVANATFAQRKGKRGYDERQVDYYLNACVQLLSRLESYEHVKDDEELMADGTLEGAGAEAAAMNVGAELGAGAAVGAGTSASAGAFAGTGLANESVPSEMQEGGSAFAGVGVPTPPQGNGVADNTETQTFAQVGAAQSSITDAVNIANAAVQPTISQRMDREGTSSLAALAQRMPTEYDAGQVAGQAGQTLNGTSGAQTSASAWGVQPANALGSVNAAAASASGFDAAGLRMGNQTGNLQAGNVGEQQVASSTFDIPDLAFPMLQSGAAPQDQAAHQAPNGNAPRQ